MNRTVEVPRPSTDVRSLGCFYVYIDEHNNLCGQLTTWTDVPSDILFTVLAGVLDGQMKEASSATLH